MQLVVALLLLMFGLAFPLLLNGQTFTNNLLGIACASAAVALSVGAARDPRLPAARRSAGRIVAGLGVLLAAALLAQLPSAYRFQGRFNQRMEQLRQRGQRAGGPGRKIEEENRCQIILLRRSPPNLALQRTRPAVAVFASIHGLLGGPVR